MIGKRKDRGGGGAKKNLPSNVVVLWRSQGCNANSSQ